MSFCFILTCTPQLESNSTLEWNKPPYSYTDVPSRNDIAKTENNATMDSAPGSKGILQQGLAERQYGTDDNNFNVSDLDSESDSNYVSFDGIEGEESDNSKETREREQLVLKAAGLVVNQDVKPPPK